MSIKYHAVQILFVKKHIEVLKNTLHSDTAYYKSNSIYLPLINVSIILALHVPEMKEPRLKTSSPQTTGHCEGF